MDRRNFLTIGTCLAAIGAALRLGTPSRAAAQTIDDAAFEIGSRYYTSGGIFQIVDGSNAEANDTTVLDLSPNARQAILLPNEPVADVSAIQTDTRLTSWFSEGQGILTRDGFAYKVARPDAEDAHVITRGGVKLYVVGPRISVDAFGADPTGQRDSTEALARAMKFCAVTGVPGYSSGHYRISGTLAPGQKYSWDWGKTFLDFTDAAKANLTEVKANPQGSHAPQPAGKYVLFDTSGCDEAVNAGSLTIIGSFPGNMRLASRAAIPANVVAITASERASADMTWGTLVLQGCGYGFWQGDQRGSAPNILPYTRWQIDYLKIQFCIYPMESGSSGNGFDDTFFTEVRLTRNGGAAILRGTDIGGGVAFINGLAPHADMENQTVTTKVGSPQVMLSAGNHNIRPGDVIAIRGVALNKAGGPTDFVARITAKSGVTLTLDRAPEVAQRRAAILCNPPGIMLAATQWRFQQTYLEEIHDVPITLANRSAVYGLVKISNGDVSSRYDCGVLLVDGSLAKVELHATSTDNKKVKAVLGVASLREQDAYNTNSVDVTVLGTYDEATINSDPLKIVALQPEDIPARYSADASSELNPNLYLTARFLDGARQYQRHGAVEGRPAFTVGGDGMLELGVSITLRSAAFGGSMSSPAAGSPVKNRGEEGYLQHAIIGGRRYRIAVTVSAFDGGTPYISWYKDGTLLSTEAIIARSAGRVILFADAPDGTDQVRLIGDRNDAYTIDEFTAAEVLSV